MAVMTPVHYTAGSDLVNTAISRVRVPRGTMKVVWGPAAGGDTAIGVLTANFPDKSIAIAATFGTSTFTVEGSNDSTTGADGTWIGLVDPQGTLISKTANAIEQILENPMWIRPVFGAGTGSAMTATLECSTVKG